MRGPLCKFCHGHVSLSQEQDSQPFVLMLGSLNISSLISVSIYQFETMLFSFLDVQSRVLVLQLCPLTVNTWTNILVFQTYQVKCSMQKVGKGGARFIHYWPPDPSCFAGLSFVTILLNGNIFIIPNKCLALANIKHFFVRINKTLIHAALFLTFY